MLPAPLLLPALLLLHHVAAHILPLDHTGHILPLYQLQPQDGHQNRAAPQGHVTVARYKEVGPWERYAL